MFTSMKAAQNLTDTLKLSILTEVTKNLVESTFNRLMLDPDEYDYSEIEELKQGAEAVGRTDVVFILEEILHDLKPKI